MAVVYRYRIPNLFAGLRASKVGYSIFNKFPKEQIKLGLIIPSFGSNEQKNKFFLELFYSFSLLFALLGNFLSLAAFEKRN